MQARSGELRRVLPKSACRRSEEHTSELQSRQYLVCRLLLEKKNDFRPAADLLFRPPARGVLLPLLRFLAPPMQHVLGCTRLSFLLPSTSSLPSPPLLRFHPS